MAKTLKAAVRRAARERRIPIEARCATCNFARPEALERWGRRWRCYECAHMARGQTTQEAHHLLGRHVHVRTSPVMGNLHRILSDKQLDIPADVQKSARTDPLAFAALLMQMERDRAAAIAEFQSTAIAAILQLRDALEARYGKNWPKKLGLPPIFAK